MYNKVTLLGNLTRDIELVTTQSGMSIAKTAIATSHKFTSNGERKEETCFIDITFFGKSAEIANQYLHKGSKILVDGRLKQDTWESDRQKRSKHTVVVETFKMVETKSNNSDAQSYSQDNHNVNKHTDYQTKQASKPTYEPNKNLLPEDEDDFEVPF